MIIVYWLQVFRLWICRKHVWANFCLAHRNEKILDDSSALQDFGIRNNSQVGFFNSSKY